MNETSTPDREEATAVFETASLTEPDAPDAAREQPMARPTVRWGALVWSLIFGAVAATTLWVVVDRPRRDAVGEWLLDLSPLVATLYLLLALGSLVAVFGIVALIRRGERARR